MGTIYILENKINKKCYVGQTVKPFIVRFKQHLSSNLAIDKALKKHGIENFEKILIENIPEEKLDDLEKEYIKKHNSLSPFGYNLIDGGSKNKHFSEEAKKNVSDGLKGNVPWIKGKHHTEEVKKILKEKSTGRKHTDETKKKMSEAQKGNKKMLGKKLTEETKKKMSVAKRNTTEETRKKISKSKIGSHHTDEAKLKMSNSHKGNTTWLGKHHTEESKRKISESKKRRGLYAK